MRKKLCSGEPEYVKSFPEKHLEKHQKITAYDKIDTFKIMISMFKKIVIYLKIFAEYKGLAECNKLLLF